MNTAPAVMVHGLGHAVGALEAAVACQRGVTLLSGVGAGAYAGVGWWQALVAAARGAVPGAAMRDILDCGSSAGRALEALRVGQRLLVLRAEARVWTDISQRAEDCGAVLLADAPEALDLGRRGAERRLRLWLEGVPGGG